MQNNSFNPADELPLMQPRLHVTRFDEIQTADQTEITVLEYRLDVDEDQLPLMMCKTTLEDVELDDSKE